ncbi:MAG: hypothetical protein BA861_10570 [Desulfobacterales bacterium S3730MH5]|nr:MAG: hypothetical protein BA861_10570 [Desulfobacterales bacterium S3730MH5]
MIANASPSVQFLRYMKNKEINSNEKIIGFDARKMWIDFNVIWNTERRSTFLIREDISQIFSTDSLVWPSVFNVYPHLETQIDWSQTRQLSGPELPEWIGPNSPLWENLQNLKIILIKTRQK